MPIARKNVPSCEFLINESKCDRKHGFSNLIIVINKIVSVQTYFSTILCRAVFECFTLEERVGLKSFFVPPWKSHLKIWVATIKLMETINQN